MLALLQETATQPDTTLVRVVCGIVAVVLIGIVILRRKKRKKIDDDDF